MDSHGHGADLGSDRRNSGQEQGDGPDGLCLAGNAQERARTLSKAPSQRGRRPKVARQGKAAKRPQKARTGQDSGRPSARANPTPSATQAGEAPEAGEARPDAERTEDPGAESLPGMADGRTVQNKRGSRCSEISRIDLNSEREISQSLDELNIEGEDRPVGRAMLAMFYCQTTNADKIAKATGLNRDFCRNIFRRMRKNGIIPAPKTLNVEWFETDKPIQHCYLSFILDLLVASGYAERVAVDGEPGYVRAT